MQDRTYPPYDTPLFMTYIVGKPVHSKLMSLQRRLSAKASSHAATDGPFSAPGAINAVEKSTGCNASGVDLSR